MYLDAPKNKVQATFLGGSEGCKVSGLIFKQCCLYGGVIKYNCTPFDVISVPCICAMDTDNGSLTVTQGMSHV